MMLGQYGILGGHEGSDWALADKLPLNKPLEVALINGDGVKFSGYTYWHPIEKFQRYWEQAGDDVLFKGINNPRFVEHHKKHPHIYEKFKELALDTKSRGFKHYSAAGIRELVRWHTAIKGDGVYKIQNTFTPLYARMVMNEVPYMDGFFRTRMASSDRKTGGPVRRKLMICGEGRHGKDTLCDFLKTKGYTFVSSSMVAAEFIFEELKDKYGYQTVMQCWEDRLNHRKEWFDMICAYNEEDPAKLARSIYESYDIYCGIRNPIEFEKAKADGLFQLSIWVDASDRLPPEGASNGITKEMCDIVIENNGTLAEFEAKMEAFYQEHLAV